jgi:hypothetical protein
VSAIREKQFAGVEGDLSFCPVDLVSHAIGNEELALTRQANGADRANAEIGIVCRDHRIVMNRGLQFLRAFYAVRDYGVRINGPGGVSTARRREFNVAPEKGQR